MNRNLCSVSMLFVLFLVLFPAGPAIAQDQQMVTSLFILVKTGDDDLRGGNDNAFVEVRAFNPDILRGDNANRSGVYVLTEAPLNNGARWKNNEFWDVEVRLPRAVPLEHLRSVVIKTNFKGGIGGDNWNIDQLEVLAIGPNRFKRKLYNRRGKPLYRFTGDKKRFHARW